MKIIRDISEKINIFYLRSKYNFIEKYLSTKTFRVLDVGAGNHTVKKIKKLYPTCDYYGIDISRNYNNDKDDFYLMEAFYEMDLTELKFDAIENNFYDAILMSHIIEHLYNGDMVIENLIKKLKIGGIIYIEFPGFTSTKLPSMEGTLNFFDDDTHIRIYSLREIYNVLLINNVKPIKGGKRRIWLRIILMPFLVTYRIIRSRKLNATDFWDLFGFAEYVVGRKI